MNQRERFELKRSLKNDKVYDIDGSFLGYAGEVLPKKMLDLRFGLLQFDDFRLKDIIYVECPVCGLRSVSLKSHKCQFDGPRVPKSRITIKCERCGKEETIVKGTYAHRISIGKQNFCTDCIRTETNLRIYGAPNQMASNNFRVKRIQTWMKNLGVDNPGKAEKDKQKIANTNLERRGVTCSLASEESKRKTKDTNIERFGYEIASKSPIVRERMAKTTFERFGATCVLASKYGKAKSRETNLERYGNEIAAKSDIVKERNRKRLEKIGVTSNWQLPHVKEKIFKNQKRGTKLERKLEEILKTNHIDCIRQYSCGNHTFDIAIFVNDKLDTLVDIDGIRYHGWLLEYGGNGKSCEIYDAARIAFVPDNIKFVCISDNDFESGVKEILEIVELSYDQWVDKTCEYFSKLKQLTINYPERILWYFIDGLYKYANSYRANYGLHAIFQFHPSILTYSENGKQTLIETITNISMIRTGILQHTIYKHPLDICKMYECLSFYNVAKLPQILKPSLAKMLVIKYLRFEQTIIDPFTEFGSKMFGVLAANKQYIAKQSNFLEETMDMVQFFNLSPIILQTLPNVSDALFTELQTSNINEVDKIISDLLTEFECHKYLFLVKATLQYSSNIVEVIDDLTCSGPISRKIVLITKDL